ncbi:hypothetical protein HBI49_147400 [Parastagonospora nodorum]|nr:hypothetical protein HBI79_143520 [Parastagonospora nodorum]KAH5357883.1 hypothetical protein HBI49_147400 [Parastagonospora nodorum]KAH5641824.1 hypothetical protein HBI51_132100 [Parastagonospora nodorum]
MRCCACTVGSWHCVRRRAGLVGAEAVLVCSSGRPEYRRSQVIWDEGPRRGAPRIIIYLRTRASGPAAKGKKTTKKRRTKEPEAVQCRSETESGCAWRSYFWPRALV